jgi:hypothetical protein
LRTTTAGPDGVSGRRATVPTVPSAPGRARASPGATTPTAERLARRA